ncbi:MAG: GTP-binding protein [Oscillospiraceae bacterium]|nr:GTP-binding protein [Oscillospiraceae bacterium]
MAKIDIISGFLGAGKTTLIKKLLEQAYQGEKIVLIENEFGEISIDGGFLQGTGVQISEMSSGCICCSLVGDFGEALKDVQAKFEPDRILIEPSGVGKLSDVIRAVEDVAAEDKALQLNSFITVADASKCRVYMKNFGEFFNNQVEHAGCIILSRTGKLSEEKIAAAVALLREHNATATIITTPWEQLDGKQILASMERTSADFIHELQELMEHEVFDDDECDDPECSCHHHHHHDHDEDGEAHEHHHHHDHDEDGEAHEHHHHHDHDEDEAHEHHHDHDEGGEHHHHHHHHHHGHDADEVFTSWGVETPKSFSAEELARILAALDTGDYGKIVRCKGIVNGGDGKWLHFDYVPEEHEVREGAADVTGRLCVIGGELAEDKLKELFGV